MKTFLQNLFSRRPAAGPVPPLLHPEASGSDRDAVPAAMQGDIAAVSLVNIFQFFSLAGLTGRLDIHSTANSGFFYFSEGILTHGVLQTSQRRIGEILVESQAITEQQLQECLRVNASTGPAKRIGEVLLERGYLHPVKLDDTLFMQMKEAFMATLSWEEGNFAFYPDLTPPHGDFQTSARIDQLLLEGMVDNDEAGV
jgi:hypothetical protein